MTHVDTPSKSILRDPVKRRAWIIYQLAIRGLSLASIARELGVTRQQPQAALRKPYPRMEKAIADTLGLAPQQLFPERYDKDGLPNRPMGRPRKSSDKSTSRAGARNGKSRRAA